MARVASGLARTLAALDEVLAAARQGALLREGVSVVLIGQPNVGKSSLMNALVGDEIAIVTEVAGTTRDAIRQEVQIEGVSFHLIDTAGLRATEDPVEKIGIARAWAAIDQAGIALLLVDAQHGLGSAEQDIVQQLPAGIARLSVHNKIDLAGEAPRVVDTGGAAEVWLSAKTGEGIPLLRRELLCLAGWQPAGEGGFMARARHLAALNRARGHLVQATDLGRQLELQAEELRLVQEALTEITGEFSPDDLLGEIFSRFCIGK
jgi:tRNA modification GTPase